jgi:hypothetical protein
MGLGLGFTAALAQELHITVENVDGDGAAGIAADIDREQSLLVGLLGFVDATLPA